MKKDDLTTALHPRSRRDRRFVYVVRSRRSRGLSLGINLDPQKTCNFDCVYCEVIDRRELLKKTGRPPIDIEEVVREVDEELAKWALPGSGEETLSDIAYAGDGEPSTFPDFAGLAERVFDARDARGFQEVPAVLITNGSGLDRSSMVLAHDLFALRGGVFWVKLDAGTSDFYTRVCRTAVPFERILKNLEAAARRHPIVVQSMFFRFHGEAPGKGEIDAYAGRLAHAVETGGKLSLVQVYTVARETMEPGITPLTILELEEIARCVRETVPGTRVAVYG